MYLYVASPTIPNGERDFDVFEFTVATMVCTTDPIKFTIKGSRWSSIMQLDMSDADLDQMIEKAIDARTKRREQKAATLTALAESEYDSGSLSMETAERLTLIGNSILTDAETPEPVTRICLEDVWTDEDRHTLCILPIGHEGDHKAGE